MENIVLIGFMGCGKTSVGKKLAEKLNYCFCDVDRVIERDYKKSISEIFETEGEEYFRELETKTLKELIKAVNNCIISVGGGLPIKDGNSKLLKELGAVVFLKIRKETILKRLEFDKTRPLLANDDREKKIEELLLYREPIYTATADIIVEVDDKEFDQILAEICNGIKVSERKAYETISNQWT